MKKLILPLIFLFCFSFLIIMSIPSYGATDTVTLSRNTIMQPVEGEWFYDERDDLIDFEVYLEGSTPNLTIGGNIDELDVTGVYKYHSELSDALLDKFNLPLYLLDDNKNFSYVTEISTTGYNNSQATWENVTINNNQSINVERIIDPLLAFDDFEDASINATMWDVSVGTTESGGALVIPDGAAAAWKTARYKEKTLGQLRQAGFDLNYTVNISSNGLAAGWENVIGIGSSPGSSDYIIGRYRPASQWQVRTNVSTFQGVSGGWASTVNYSLTIIIHDNSSISYYLDHVWKGTYDISGDANLNNYYLWFGGSTGIHKANVFIVESVIEKDYENDGYYISSVIELENEINILDIAVDITEYENNNLSIELSNNDTGDFDNWVNYTNFINQSVEFLKFRVIFNQTNGTYVSVFRHMNITYFKNVNYLMNNDDKILMIHPVKNNTLPPAEFFYTFNVSDSGGYVQGEVEFIFVHAIYNYDWAVDLDESSNGEFFTVLLNNEQQFQFKLRQYNNSGTWFGNWSLWNGGNEYHQIELIEYDVHPSGYSFLCYNVIIDYTYNSKVTLRVSKMDSFDSATLLFENTTAMVNNNTTPTVDYANFHFGANQTKGEAMVFLGIDTSRVGTNYLRNRMFTNVTKSFIAYNYEDIFTFSMPQATSERGDIRISQMRIKSELQKSDFVSFVLVVAGDTGYNQIFIDLNDYQVVASSIFTSDISLLHVNAKYRCKNLNQFNNTIYVEVTYIYVPQDPDFMTLMISAMPPLVLLLVPSGVAYSKFKKNGFLITFFLMTLILTIVGMLPFVPGLLMLGIEAVIFLKLMAKESEE